MKLKYKLWLDNNGKAFGQGPYQLLIGIKNTGSLAQAAKMMNMSYSHAHLLMKSLANNLGFPLIDSQAGGKGGGGTVITPQAEELLKNYTAFCRECNEVIGNTFLKYFPGPDNGTDSFLLEMTGEDDALDAFSLREKEVIVLVGGGGKTSIMFALAKKLFEKRKKVVVCTTTKIFIPSPDRIDRLLVSEEDSLLARLEEDLKKTGVIAVGTGIKNGKLSEVSPAFINQLVQKDLADYILIEGDGAARKPFKAPSEYEPVIPESATYVMTVVGVDALGKELRLQNVHRVKEISALTGLKEGEIISEDIIASVLTHENGGRKNVPPHARWLPIINKVDYEDDLESAERIARSLVERGVKMGILSSVHDNKLAAKTF